MTYYTQHREFGRKNGHGGSADTLARDLKTALEDVQRFGNDAAAEIRGMKANIKEIEQIVAGGGRGDFGSGGSKSAGQVVIESDEFKSFGGSNRKGKVSIEVKAITSGAASAGAMIAPDRSQGIVLLPQQRLTVRDLLGQGNTNSNAVEYTRQTVRTNGAAFQANEGDRKGQSDYQFELATATIKTLAHWVKVSRQALDDAPLLRATVDGELRFGLQLKEEQAFLHGDGTSNSILGIVPQATAYETTRNKTGDTRFDTIAHAIAQAEQARLPVTGVVMNDQDLEALKTIKDADGRYIGGGPFGPPITSIWGKLAVGTPEIQPGEFVTGAFRDGAMVVDRLDAMIELGTDGEDFTRNLLTVLCEARMTLIVRRPASFVAGTFPDVA